MKPKAQTLQQRMGFADPDLATPKHDALMVELDSNIKHYLSTINLAQFAGFKDVEITDEIRRVTWEMAVTNHNRYVLGFTDLAVCAVGTTRTDAYRFDVWFYFEVKPVIASVGEVIRQIRHYQTGVRSGFELWVIASPDDRFRSVIEAQGIGFVQLPDCGA